MDMYSQCRLVKENREQVSWIPSKHAIVGRTLGLKSEDGWEEGWVVTDVYTEMDGESILKGRDAYRYHRQNTDI